MLKTVKKVALTLNDGRSIEIETGKLAKQANGSVVVTMGDTMLLGTVVSDKDAKDDVDFLPLTVDYREKYGSAGKIPGGFLKREARPTDSEILTSRLIDRALRPLFPDDYHANTQVMVTLISGDAKTLPDALACLAASAAICVSDIPFNGPISETRVAKVGSEMIINPDRETLEEASIDIMVAATNDSIVMVEGEMKEVSEDEMLEAIKVAHDAIKLQCQMQLDLAAQVEKSHTKREYCHENHDEEILANMTAACKESLKAIASEGIADKAIRGKKFADVKEAYLETLSDEVKSENKFLISQYFKKIQKEALREVVLTTRKRLDGRDLTEIRPIWSEVNYLPGAHGSAVFTRGETQALTTVTLGTKLDEKLIDAALIKGTEKFLLHYNFPAFSTGEARPNRGTSRREVGHGNLALRAIKPMLPTDEKNPYTIRVVSDILESNGSSSMATVCAGTLALMDAGVQIKKPVSGIAMGLITDKSGNFAVLSDILGDEDHLGDMDFKVTGTQEGITACQMDIKVDGLSFEILSQALHQAKDGRLHILGEMNKTLAAPNEDYKPNVPRIIQLKVDKEFIGAIIGPGGKIIQDIQKESGATVIIEEQGEFGIVDIISDNKDASDMAIARVKAIITQPEVDEIYEGKVKSITNFGAFVEILPGKDGLLHISEIEWRRLNSVEEVLKEGDVVKVKLIQIDPKTKKLKLSRKILLPKPEKQTQES